jgi:hypothetical protein
MAEEFSAQPGENQRASPRELEEKRGQNRALPRDDGREAGTEKAIKTLSDDAFFVAGLMLYAAEGSKKEAYHICVANTEGRIIKFFMEWLCKFFRIEREEFRAELHLYPTMDIPKEMLFWKTELGLEEGQFYKTQIRELKKSSFSYCESFRHGTCSLNVTSVKKKTEIMMAIKALMGFRW